MARYRRPLAVAVALNAAIVAIEMLAGYQAGSLSLVMDGIHNLSDEMALAFLFLAFVLPFGVSCNLMRCANLFNSVGLVGVSGLLFIQAAERLVHPAPVLGFVPVVVGLVAAAGNWAIARTLRGPGRNNAAIRLAYVHSVGDVYVSLVPVLAGLLVTVSGHSVFDPLLACGVALWLAVWTIRQVIGSYEELIWPESIDHTSPQPPPGDVRGAGTSS